MEHNVVDAVLPSISANNPAPDDDALEPCDPAELSRQENPSFASNNARTDLLASESRFRVLFEQVNDGIFLGHVSDGSCAEVNTALCRVLGYPRERP